MEGDGDKRFADSFSEHKNLYEMANECYKSEKKLNFVGQ